MKTTIWGNILPAVTIDLEQGESIYTESGGMTWMSDKVKMDTNMKGGFMKGLGRMFSGESLFMATYTAEAPNQSITIASSFPGEIKELHISSDKEFICQKSAFLCAEQSVELSTYITSGIKKGLFGGEGFVLQKLSGNALPRQVQDFSRQPFLKPFPIQCCLMLSTFHTKYAFRFQVLS